MVILAQYGRSKEQSRALCRGSINKMLQRSGLNLMPSSYKFKLVLLKLKGSRAMQYKFKPSTRAL
nr:hypothetical protein [uncultured Campylobacter sp.]